MQLLARHARYTAPADPEHKLSPAEAIAWNYGPTLFPAADFDYTGLAPALNPGRTEHWLFDVIEWFPNVLLLPGKHYHVELEFWPLSANETDITMTAYAYPPQNYAQRISLEFFRTRLREVAREDMNTLEAQHAAIRPACCRRCSCRSRNWCSRIITVSPSKCSALRSDADAGIAGWLRGTRAVRGAMGPCDQEGTPSQARRLAPRGRTELLSGDDAAHPPTSSRISPAFQAPIPTTCRRRSAISTTSRSPSWRPRTRSTSTGSGPTSTMPFRSSGWSTWRRSICGSRQDGLSEANPSRPAMRMKGFAELNPSYEAAPSALAQLPRAPCRSNMFDYRLNANNGGLPHARAE